jgi:molybdate transport system substrate-binding protein
MRLRMIAVAFGLMLSAMAAPAAADKTHVAVAANFNERAREIAALFQKKTGHEAILITGASGAFYTQITHGAPFEVFLSADNERPRLAVENGYAVADSRFTYAIGKLVLWSRAVDVTNGEEVLKAGDFRKLSIANPASAIEGGTRWTVPDKLHSPILQDAVLLKKGADNKAAKAFLAFLKGPEARAVIERYGYALE